MRFNLACTGRRWNFSRTLCSSWFWKINLKNGVCLLAIAFLLYVSGLVFQSWSFHTSRLSNLRRAMGVFVPFSISPKKPARVLKQVTTNLSIEKLLDDLAFPVPRGEGNIDVFNDDIVKRQLTQKLPQKNWSRENKLKVFVVLHSHNDPGWKKTFENYFYDSTKHILNYMLEYLTGDEKLKFIWAEMSFFSLWWKGLSSEKKGQVKRLVDKKQLEFVAGGWVMPDEANVHYISYITQLIEGHQFLKHHLNYTPSVGWSIDPFGISATLNFLQGRAGINKTVFNRVHYVLKQYLRKSKSLEFTWNQHFDEQGKSPVSSYLMPYYSYDSYQTCGPDSQQICKSFQQDLDVKNREKVTRRATKVLYQLRKKSLIFQTNNLLWPVGGDFYWKTKRDWEIDARNLKAIVEFINSEETLFTEMKFATLSEYFQAVDEDMTKNGLTRPTLSGDFFTYSGEALDYWSGYFTTRIFHKTTERQLMSLLRNAQMLFTLLSAEIAKSWRMLSFDFIEDMLKAIVKSRRVISLFQHHDAITGTSKDPVVVDYAKKIYAAMLDCQFVAQQSIFVLTNIEKFLEGTYSLDKIKPSQKFYKPTISKLGHYWNTWRLDVLNVSSDASEDTVVTITNSLEYSRNQLFQLAVTSPHVRVLTLEGELVPSEVFPIFRNRSQNKRQRGDENIKSVVEAFDDRFELNFLASLKPLEIKSYIITLRSFSPRPKAATIQFSKHTSIKVTSKFRDTFAITQAKPDLLTIGNDHLEVSFSENGTAESITLDGILVPLQLSFFVLQSMPGSGLYSFVPGKRELPVGKETNPAVIMVQGSLKSYVEVWFASVKHKLTIFHLEGLDKYSLDVENTINVSQQENYELLMRLSTTIESEDVFFTDSNGFQMIRRKRRRKFPTQGNFYPMAATAFIEDKSMRMTILSAQPGAVTSFSSGNLEIVQDRIVTWDDGHDAGQGVTDNLETVSRYKIALEALNTSPVENLEIEFENESNLTVPVLSIYSHHLLHGLLHPLMGFVKQTEPFCGKDATCEINSRQGATHKGALGQEIINHDYQPTLNLSPCDIFLVTAQPLPEYRDSNEDSRIHAVVGHQVGLVYHRLGFDPRFDPPEIMPQSCVLSTTGIVNVQDLFGNRFAEGVTLQNSWSFSSEDLGQPTSEFSLDVMDVRGVLVNYSNLGDNLWQMPILFDIDF